MAVFIAQNTLFLNGRRITSILTDVPSKAIDTHRELPLKFNDAREYYTASKRLFVDFCERLRPVLVPIMEYAQRQHDGL